MRRAVFVLIVFLLVGCGGNMAPTATPLATATITPTAPATPVANVAATATRGAELAQVATLSAPTPTVVAALPTPTALAPPSTPIPVTLAAATATNAPIPATSTTVPPPPTAMPTATLAASSSAQIVRGLDNDPVNVRERPSMQAAVVALLQPNTDALIAGPASTDEQGQRWLWVRLGAGGKDGFVRADLVGTPRAGVVAVPAAAVSAPTNSAVPTSTGPSDPTAYAAYLQSKFGSYGSHRIDIKNVQITNVPNGYAVTFFVSNSEALYIFKSARKSDLQVWATALVTELKGHWPNQYVAGNLEYQYDTFTPGTKTDCHYVSYNDPSLDTGFYVTDDFVHAYYIPPMGGVSTGTDSLKVCYAT